MCREDTAEKPGGVAEREKGKKSREVERERGAAGVKKNVGNRRGCGSSGTKRLRKSQTFARALGIGPGVARNRGGRLLGGMTGQRSAVGKSSGRRAIFRLVSSRAPETPGIA